MKYITKEIREERSYAFYLAISYRFNNHKTLDNELDYLDKTMIDNDKKLWICLI